MIPGTLNQAVLNSGTSAAPVAPLTGMIGWWDVSVSSSLSLTGSAVNSIADLSGNSQTLLSASHAPTYSATGFNSKPGITFSSSPSSQALALTGFPMGTGNTATIYFVGTRALANAGSFVRYMSYVGSGATDDFNSAGSWAITGVAGTVGQIMWQRNSANVAGSIGAGNHVVIVTVNSSGLMTLYADGVSVATTTIAGNWLSSGTLNIGREASSAFAYVDATLAEWGVATAFTSSTDVTTLYNNLKTKWGL